MKSNDEKTSRGSPGLVTRRLRTLKGPAINKFYLLFLLEGNENLYMAIIGGPVGLLTALLMNVREIDG